MSDFQGYVFSNKNVAATQRRARARAQARVPNIPRPGGPTYGPTLGLGGVGACHIPALGYRGVGYLGKLNTSKLNKSKIDFRLTSDLFHKFLGQIRSKFDP